MWKFRPDDRLDRWKQFRRSLSAMPLEQALQECDAFWQGAPFSPYYLDYNDPGKWPDPWQLVYENYYCDLAKALGIVYTLHLSDHGPNLDLSILVCQDMQSRGQYNLAWVNEGKYVLNFTPGAVVNRTHIPNNFKNLALFNSQDLKLNNY